MPDRIGPRSCCRFRAGRETSKNLKKDFDSFLSSCARCKNGVGYSMKPTQSPAEPIPAGPTLPMRQRLRMVWGNALTVAAPLMRGPPNCQKVSLPPMFSSFLFRSLPRFALSAGGSALLFYQCSNALPWSWPCRLLRGGSTGTTPGLGASSL